MADSRAKRGTGRDPVKRAKSEAKFREARHAWFDSLISEKKSSGCITCGEMDPRCLDLHHSNPSDKLFQVSGPAYSRRKESVVREADKCAVLCANCHRKLHSMEVTDGE